jgi:hypothetical protein
MASIASSTVMPGFAENTVDLGPQHGSEATSPMGRFGYVNVARLLAADEFFAALSPAPTKTP